MIAYKSKKKNNNNYAKMTAEQQLAPQYLV